jgi:PAS domain S-box-containing protein
MPDEDHLNLCVNDYIASVIIRSMSDGLLVLDFQGHILSINPAALEMLNLRWEEIRDKTYEEIFLNNPENDAFNDFLVSGIQKHESRPYREVPFYRGDGRLLDFAMTTSLLRSDNEDGEARGIVVVFKDITESKTLDRARQRVLDHLSHELKTPLAVITASMGHTATSRNSAAMERIGRNLKRLEDIQFEVEDIVRQKDFEEHYPLKRWLEQILDLAEALAEGTPSCGETLQTVRSRMEELFKVERPVLQKQKVNLGQYLRRTVESARKLSSHRQIEFVTDIEEDPEIRTAPAVLEKALMAPVKNAIENTPDGGTIIVSLKTSDEKALVEIRDTGIGITEESQKQIFGGFYHARETDFYSTKRPFDFGAGGKGLDLLRLRIFGEVYHFQIEWESRRCRYIPRERDLCPGAITLCPHIRSKEECDRSGGTLFRLIFSLQ